MSDISYIPDELLSEIFLQLRPYRATIRYFHSYDTTREQLHYPRPCYQKRYPWVLTHVCRRWRCIAQATPQLWSYLPAIDLSGEPDLYDDSLDHFLNYAKYSPLSLFFWGKNRSTDGTILSTFVKHIQKWRDVTFFFPDENLPPLDMIKSQFKALHKATLIGRWVAPVPSDLFADAPVLEELEWLIGRTPVPILPPSLTRFYGYWPGPLAALALLSSVPSLVECKLQANNSHPDSIKYILPNLPLAMPHLTTLVLRDCRTRLNEESEDAFLGSLTLPKLKHLELWLTTNTGANFRYEDITKLLGRSRAPLKSLTLAFHVQTFPTPNQLKEVLEETPELEFYRLYSCESIGIKPEQPLLSILLDPELVPKLSTLIWDSYDTLSFPDNLVTDIVRMRSRSRYGADMEDSVGESNPCSLAYFALNQFEVRSEVRDALVGWSHAEDLHYPRLAEISQRLQRHFALPVFKRTLEVAADINTDIEWIIANNESFHILAVLASKIHLTFFELVIRGQSEGRVECDWIPRVAPIVSEWQSDSKQHFRNSCWFAHHEQLYWVADGQYDVYDLFWQVGPSHVFGFHKARRSIPVKWTDHTWPVGWMPDWERAELPPKSYEPGEVG